MSSMKGYETPPSSDVEPDHALPPSPPASPKPRSDVDRLLGAIRLLKYGSLSSRYLRRTYKLSLEEFGRFNQRLSEDERLWGYYEDKVRYDYDPRENGGEYVLRMPPSALHDRFVVLVAGRIQEEVKSLARKLAETENHAAELLRQVGQGGSPTLRLQAPKLENSSQSSTEGGEASAVVHKSPDATFFCEASALHPLVLEVSYSQHVKDLSRLAETYIVDSRHRIRCVLGLDITYAKKGSKKQDKTASVSVWRPHVEVDQGERVGVYKCDMNASPFRNAEGESCAGELKLTLADFLPRDALDDMDVAEQSIKVPFEDICQYLLDAEERARKVAAPLEPSSAAPMRFRKRKRSPAERLSEERELAYVAEEEAELQKEGRLDSEWKGAGRSRAEQPAAAGAQVEVEVRRSKRNKSGRSASQGS